MQIRSRSLSFRCSVCADNELITVHRASNGDFVPALVENDTESFCVTCPKCFSIFSVDVKPVLTLQMNSNLIRGKVVK